MSLRLGTSLALALTCLATAGASPAAAHSSPPRAGTADSGCREQGQSTLYKLTRHRVRALKRKFARSHHGYKFVTMGTSIFAPPHYVGVYWLKPGGPGGTYAAGGVTYYCNGRMVKHPVHNALVAFDVTALFTIESHGSGTYTDVKTVTDPDPDGGGTTTYTKTASFQWDNSYGTPKKPVPIQIDTTEQTITGGMPADALKFSITGSASYQVTNSSDPSQDFTCTYTIGGRTQAEFGWDKAPHNGGIAFEEDLEPPAMNLVSNSDPNQTCDDPAPGDPSGSGLTLAYATPVLPPGKQSGGAALWEPFSVSPGYHHHSHSDTTDPDSGLRYVEDKDLNLTAGTQFLLRGVAPPSG
jgi:hypothetical protein